MKKSEAIHVNVGSIVNFVHELYKIYKLNSTDIAVYVSNELRNPIVVFHKSTNNVDVVDNEGCVWAYDKQGIC